MSKAASTPATLFLTRAGKPFTLHPYDYAAGEDHHKGVYAAHALGQAEERVFKTLMVELDGRPACVVIPVARSLSMKKVAAYFGAKHAVMMAPDKAERLTGYRVGGISPFGQKRAVPTVLDESAVGQESIFINAGKRGLLLEIAPDDAVSILKGGFAAITTE